jgi:hypothetical protein
MAENAVYCNTAMPRHSVGRSFAFLCCTVALLAGCSIRKKPAIAWGTAVLVRPVVPPRSSPATDPAEDPAPELRIEPSPASPGLVTVPSVPPRPRSAMPSSARNDAEKPDAPAPVIAPQLTAEETSSAQQETNASLSIAEKNLALTQGKRFSAAQADLVSKVKGFIANAREAARINDWTQARSLAKKAQVLSEELLASR